MTIPEPHFKFVFTVGLVFDSSRGVFSWHRVAETSSRTDSKYFVSSKRSATSAGVVLAVFLVLFAAWFSHLSVGNNAVPGCSQLREMKSRSTQWGRANRANGATCCFGIIKTTCKTQILGNELIFQHKVGQLRTDQLLNNPLHKKKGEVVKHSNMYLYTTGSMYVKCTADKYRRVPLDL